MNKNILISIAVATLVFGGIIGYYFGYERGSDKSNQTDSPQDQTENQPEGQPEDQSENQPEGQSGWKTFTDPQEGVSFQYPETLMTKYMDASDWPPQAEVLNESFTCLEAGDEADRAGKTERRLVGNREYCVTTITEGAAGSVYNQYAYAFAKDNKTVILSFTLRLDQCANYDEPAMSECKTERETFDIDGVVDRIVRTLVLE